MRLETGVVQFGDDWPSLYVRGDNAFFFAHWVEEAAQKIEDVYLVSKLMEIVERFLTPDVRRHNPITYLKPAEDCLIIQEPTMENGDGI